MIEKITKILPLAILIMMLHLHTSFAQSAEDKGSHESLDQKSPERKEGTKEVELNKDYLKGYITDTKEILTSPSRWDKTDWLKFSLVAGTTIGLYALDYDIKDRAQKWRNNTTDNVSRLVEPFGSALLCVPTFGAFYLYGHYLEDKKAQTTGLLGLESLVVSAVFTGTIKFATHRWRPSETDQSNKWDGPSFSGSHLSFPSMDSTLAFSMGTVIATEYHDIPWVPPLAYTIATLTGLSRINDNDHWASDVFLGSAIGFFTAKAILALHKKNSKIAVIPVIDGRVRGVALGYRF